MQFYRELELFSSPRQMLIRKDGQPMGGSRFLRPWTRFAVVLFSLLAVFAGRAKADQIVMKNGDRLTGTINTADSSQITITCPIEGKLTVNMSDVKTFSTTEPIKIVLNDGSIIIAPAMEGNEGTIDTVATGTVTPQTVHFSQMSAVNPPPIVWTGSLAIDGSYAQNDTTAVTLGATLNLARRGEHDRILFGAQYLYGWQKVNDVSSTTTDQWYAAPEYDYFFTKQLYLAGTVRVEKNRIINLDIRVTPAVSVGYQFVERPDFNASVEGGLAWVYEEYSTAIQPNENFSLRLAYHIDKTLWEKLKLFSDCAYYPSMQNSSKYLVIFDAGLRYALSAAMFTSLRYEVQYDSQPAPGSHRTSEQLLFGVGWTF
jgi:hypothetical protein